MSNLIDHAKRELDAAGIVGTDDGPDKWMRDALLELLEVFSNQGHSGFSAPICISTFAKLAKFEPLVPLTGADNEWTHVHGMHESGVWQNKRAGNVFKDDLIGRAYQMDYRVFKDPDGCHVTSWASREYIEFPYTPTHIYVNRNHDGTWEGCEAYKVQRDRIEGR